MEVTGLPALKSKLRDLGKRYGDRVARGLKKAGLFLQREAQELCPVDTGNLKNGASTRSEGNGIDTVVTVGFQAAYAVFVHENKNARHPVGQAKFLERPAREKVGEMADIITAEARR